MHQGRVNEMLVGSTKHAARRLRQTWSTKCSR